MVVNRRRRPLLAITALSITLLSSANGFLTSPVKVSISISPLGRSTSSPEPTASDGEHRKNHGFSANIRRTSFPSLFQSTASDEIISQNSSRKDITVFESMAQAFVSKDYATNPAQLLKYGQIVTAFRVGIPALAFASTAGLLYPTISNTMNEMINDSGAFSVIAQDSSQYIQNILTTCGLMFSILTGYTWYFMYMQQESIFLALFEETTAVKILLEQIALVCEGRKEMYRDILDSIKRYVRDDLTQFTVEPSILLSSRPVDDPLQEIMYLTSVGEPSVVYQSVKALRQARAYRLGALQRKLPQIHFILLWSLAAIVLVTFPVLGAGVQTIGGQAILGVQRVYLSFIVFGITMILGIIDELYKPAGDGAYNVAATLSIMVEGLEEELEGRLEDRYLTSFLSPTNDATSATWGNDADELQAFLLAETSSLKPETAPIPALPSSTDSSETAETGLATKESLPWFGKRIVNRIRNGRRH